MRTVQFGISLVPNIADMSQLRELARLADALGLDLLGIQDHPYVSRFFDTMSLISVLLAETGRLRIFPNVASLPLRPPALLAKSAASLDMLVAGASNWGLVLEPPGKESRRWGGSGAHPTKRSRRWRRVSRSCEPSGTGKAACALTGNTTRCVDSNPVPGQPIPWESGSARSVKRCCT